MRKDSAFPAGAARGRCETGSPAGGSGMGGNGAGLAKLANRVVLGSGFL